MGATDQWNPLSDLSWMGGSVSTRPEHSGEGISGPVWAQVPQHWSLVSLYLLGPELAPRWWSVLITVVDQWFYGGRDMYIVSRKQSRTLMVIKILFGDNSCIRVDWAPRGFVRWWLGDSKGEWGGAWRGGGTLGAIAESGKWENARSR